ncbi:hypothetical protein TNCV_4410121 [Trichonephila clavipes]|nr:hypothetical protein TNCV_4410121 [Trichonephila clavipes]
MFSYHEIGARVQRNSSTVMQYWKQWTDEQRTTRKTGSGRWKVTSSLVERHLLHFAVNERAAFSRQLEAGSPLRQTIDSCVCNRLMSTEPAKLIGINLPFQMNHASICDTMIAAFASATMPHDNARPHVAKTVRDICSAQHMQLLPWPAYSLEMPPIEHVWDSVSWHLALDLHPAASKDEL